jgi:VWFA-related protein
MKLQFAVAPLLAITVFTATPGHAQQETFSDTASVLVVEVPVRVLRDGRPVRDLTAADFELFDRRRRVETFGLDVLDFSSAADAGAAHPDAAHPDAAHPDASHPDAAVSHHPWYQGRSYLFVYDFALSYNRRMLYEVSAGVRELLATRLGPRDRVSIALFRGHRELITVLDFTNDRDAIVTALELVDFVLQGNFDGARQVLGRLRATTPNADARRAFGTGWGREPMLPRRARRFTGREQVPDDPLTLETLAIFDYRDASERKRILNFARALVAMAGSTADLHGQKQLILFSSGWPDKFLFGDRKNVGTMMVVRRILRAFRQHNWAIQGVNSGLWMDQHTTALSHLAYDTGGEVFSNSNNVAELLDDMFERTEQIYLLSFQPPIEEFDGRQHRLKVRLKGGKRGNVLNTQVIHRPGYRAPKRGEPAPQ